METKSTFKTRPDTCIRWCCRQRFLSRWGVIRVYLRVTGQHLQQLLGAQQQGSRVEPRPETQPHISDSVQTCSAQSSRGRSSKRRRRSSRRRSSRGRRCSKRRRSRRRRRSKRRRSMRGSRRRSYCNKEIRSS